MKAIHLVDWDKENVFETGAGYAFNFTLSEVPDYEWQKCFKESADLVNGSGFAGKLTTDVKSPIKQEAPAYAVVYGNPNELENRLLPQLKRIVEHANVLYQQKQEEEQIRLRRLSEKKAADDKALTEIKSRFKMQ